MTKAAAIYTFLSGFGLAAYDAFSVPTGEGTPVMPYLTYTFTSGFWESGETPLQLDLWYLSTDNTAINAKAEQIGNYIGLGGVKLDCDGGQIWVKRGSPFAQPMADPNSADIKRRYINLTADFLTTN